MSVRPSARTLFENFYVTRKLTILNEYLFNQMLIFRVIQYKLTMYSHIIFHVWPSVCDTWLVRSLIAFLSLARSFAPVNETRSCLYVDYVT